MLGASRPPKYCCGGYWTKGSRRTRARWTRRTCARRALDAATTAALDALGEDWCADDPAWYECTKKAAAA